MIIENVWNKFLLSPMEMRDYIDKLDSAYVGSYLDIGKPVGPALPVIMKTLVLQERCSQ